MIAILKYVSKLTQPITWLVSGLFDQLQIELVAEGLLIQTLLNAQLYHCDTVINFHLWEPRATGGRDACRGKKRREGERVGGRGRGGKGGRGRGRKRKRRRRKRREGRMESYTIGLSQHRR